MQKTFKVKNATYTFDTEKATISVEKGNKRWTQIADFDPSIVIPNGKDSVRAIYFSTVHSVKHELYEDGISYGLRSHYRGFEFEGRVIDYAYTTLIWVHKTTGRVYFDIIPINEPENISYINWPAPFDFVRTDEKAYTVLTACQGTIIPSNMSVDYARAGLMNFTEAGNTMPWFAQIDNGNGYIAIVETRWNANHWMTHKGDSSIPTSCQVIWMASLGKLDYTRRLRVEFFENSDYVTMAKAYRQYVKENGELVTLAQKALANPKINDMVGAPIIHSEIYYYIKPEARIYSKDNPQKNYRLHSFEYRAKQIEELKKKGLKKAYLHLDGWSIDGYDQQHPDVIPPCEKAGGIEGLKALYEVCKKNDIVFALHDQYRDYYWDARTYDKKNSILNIKGEYPHDCTWNGGDQDFLCQTLHEHYITRNYDMLEDMGFKPDGVYLDVYAATGLDECANPEHILTKRDCMNLRKKCMAMLGSRGIIISSESGVDAYFPNMVLCHHAYYRGGYSYNKKNVAEYGIEVPLINLVYHDCFMIPWTMKPTYDNCDEIFEFKFLDALANGGVGYLSIDAEKWEIEKIDILSELHKKVAFCEMTNYEFLSEDKAIQRSTFSNGIRVTVNYNDLTYSIEE